MSHELEIVQLYAIGKCECSPEEQQDEETHPEDAFGNGTYCLRTPTGTACEICSSDVGVWTEHIETEEDEYDDEATS